ncbi:MAG: adenosylmethionine decarboxylase [Gammaproteobacteria bacterium]|nr:adenosylmethionine decarboxylase [Gammaproteobacteria bacterium]
MKPHGQHLIIDIYQAKNINDIEIIKNAIHEVIHILNATLLSENYHYFEPHGVTGVACLAESHISCHTWPEDNYAAFDVFVCGDINPELSLNIFNKYFSGTIESRLINR